MVVTRNERRKELSRAKLINGARQVVAEKGVEAMTIRDIAEAADVGAGSFYNYFDSKEAVLAVIVDELLTSFVNMTDAVLESIDDAAEKLACAASGFLQMAQRDPLLMQFLLSPEAVNHRVGDEALKSLMRDLELGRCQGRFDIANPALTARMMLGAMEGFLQPRKQDPSFPDDLRRVVATLLRMLGVPGDEANTIAAQYAPNLAESK